MIEIAIKTAGLTGKLWLRKYHLFWTPNSPPDAQYPREDKFT